MEEELERLAPGSRQQLLAPRPIRDQSWLPSRLPQAGVSVVADPDSRGTSRRVFR
jgi:hypothetical protein